MEPHAIDHSALHARARERGVNPLVYWLVRAVFQPVFHLYFRLGRIGREHVPEHGPVIFAANHRSFLDPFVIATIARRPMYYVAKEELFRNRLLGWWLNSLGAFPVRRGAGDQDMLTTAKAILARGDAVLIFAEGTRTRPGGLGRPKRGVGRLALETGAPVVPVAIFGTEAIRRGWRIRPHKVRIRVGRPLTFPQVDEASPRLAAAVTDRIWPNVMLQWEWLGGLPPLRRAAVIGTAAPAADTAALLACAGLAVDLAPAGGALTPARRDLLCFALPAAELPAAVAAHRDAIGPQTGVLVVGNGLVAPRNVPAWAAGALGVPSAATSGGRGAAVTLAATQPAFARQVADALRAAGVSVIAPGAAEGPVRRSSRPAARAA